MLHLDCPARCLRAICKPASPAELRSNTFPDDLVLPAVQPAETRIIVGMSWPVSCKDHLFLFASNKEARLFVHRSRTAAALQMAGVAMDCSQVDTRMSQTSCLGSYKLERLS